MDMTGYLGKKVDLVCKDGREISGYVYDILDAEDSDIGVDSIEISPLESIAIIELALNDIKSVTVDKKYKTIDFRGDSDGGLFADQPTMAPA